MRKSSGIVTFAKLLKLLNLLRWNAHRVDNVRSRSKEAATVAMRTNRRKLYSCFGLKSGYSRIAVVTESNDWLVPGCVCIGISIATDGNRYITAARSSAATDRRQLKSLARACCWPAIGCKPIYVYRNCSPLNRRTNTHRRFGIGITS